MKTHNRTKQGIKENGFPLFADESDPQYTCQHCKCLRPRQQGFHASKDTEHFYFHQRNERRGRVVSIPASYSEGLGFIS
jgi:hypothetical protein